MLTWILRGILLGEITLWMAIVAAVNGRFAPIAAILLFPLVFLLLCALLLAVAYVLSRLRTTPAAVVGGPPTLAAIVAEWAAFVALFGVVMPFERLFMGSDAVGRLAPGRRPVLLVHGYMCNRGLWRWFRGRLRERGFAVATVTLETPFSDIERLADRLDARIDALLAETGADRVLLVTHSMGGLVARALMRRTGETRIARFVTLAGPHHGTVVAPLGFGRNTRQMTPSTPWLAALNAASPPDVPTLSLWSGGDEIVVPQDSSRLAFAREIVLPALGHLALVLSPTVVAAVADDLAADPGALTDAGRA